MPEHHCAALIASQTAAPAPGAPTSPASRDRCGASYSGPPGRPQTRLGDVWQLGPHRLICGDATSPADVAVALDGATPHLMVTDPPYGVEYRPEWRAKAWRGAHAVGQVLNDDRADWREAWALFPGDVAYVWHGALNGSIVQASLEVAGFRVRSQIIWDKGRLIISRGHYHWRHEPCWYAVRKNRTARWTGDRRQMTVWPIAHRRSETGHATQKPLEAMRRPILNHSRPGDAVYDPFLGSGTTLIAAEETGRVFYGLELNPAHVDLAIARWEGLTGRTATLLLTPAPPAT